MCNSGTVPTDVHRCSNAFFLNTVLKKLSVLISESVVLKFLCTYSSINPDYGDIPAVLQ